MRCGCGDSARWKFGAFLRKFERKYERIMKKFERETRVEHVDTYVNINFVT